MEPEYNAPYELSAVFGQDESFKFKSNDRRVVVGDCGPIGQSYGVTYIYNARRQREEGREGHKLYGGSNIGKPLSVYFRDLVGGGRGRDDEYYAADTAVTHARNLIECARLGFIEPGKYKYVKEKVLKKGFFWNSAETRHGFVKIDGGSGRVDEARSSLLHSVIAPSNILDETVKADLNL